MRGTRSIIFMAGLVLSGFMQSSMADTITVCLDGTCDYSNPTEAANAAVPGDVVEIAAGTYLLEEPVESYGVQMTIRGAVDSSGEPATILDGQGALIVLGTVGADQAVFENLVITNGYGDYGGGASFTASTGVTVRNCHFVGNHANWNGGGVRLSLDTTLTLIDCVISGNTADHPQWGGQSYGAGVHNSGATVNLQRTRVCGNVESANPGQQVSGSPPVNQGGCIEDDCNVCNTTDLADLDFNGSIDVVDLLLLLDSWAGSGTADIDNSGVVDVADVLLLLSRWS